MTEKTNSSEEVTREPSPPLSAVIGGVFALLASTAALLMGNGLQGTLIPVRGNIEAFASFEIGLLGTGYYIGFTLGCVFGSMLLQRGGHIRTFMAMSSVASVVALLHAIVLEPYIWSILRGITGFCFAVLYVVIESWLNEKSSNETRGTIFSIYTIMNLCMLTAGQMLIALGDPALFALFAVASILVSLASLPLAFTTSATPNLPKFELPKLGELYRTSPVGFAGCLAVGLANGAFWTLGPVFAQDSGFDTAGIGLYMSAVVIGGAVSQWPLGAASDKVDRRYILCVSSAIAAAAALTMIALPSINTTWLLLLGAAFGAGAFPMYSIVVAHTNDHAAPSDMVKVSSGLLLLFGIGAAVGPLIAGVIETLVEGSALFLYTALIHVLLIAFVLWRLRRRSRVAEEERIRFNESIISAQTVSQIQTESAEAPPTQAEQQEQQEQANTPEEANPDNGRST